MLLILMSINYSCIAFNKLKSDIEYCKIINEILNNKVTYKLLGLDNAKGPYPPIRIGDNTGYFLECYGVFLDKEKNLYIPYEVIHGIKPDVNCGHYRDLIIDEVKINRDTIVLIAYGAMHETGYDNMNETYLLIYKYKIAKGMPLEITTKVYEWRYTREPIDYDKIK